MRITSAAQTSCFLADMAEARPQFTTPLDPGSLKLRATDAKHMEKVRHEYLDMPSYMATPAEMPPDVKHKNRYTNVLPTERTRVPLSPVAGDPASWFINANYVQTFLHTPCTPTLPLSMHSDYQSHLVARGLCISFSREFVVGIRLQQWNRASYVLLRR